MTARKYTTEDLYRNKSDNCTRSMVLNRFFLHKKRLSCNMNEYFTCMTFLWGHTVQRHPSPWLCNEMSFVSRGEHHTMLALITYIHQIWRGNKCCLSRKFSRCPVGQSRSGQFRLINSSHWICLQSIFGVFCCGMEPFVTSSCIQNKKQDGGCGYSLLALKLEGYECLSDCTRWD